MVLDADGFEIRTGIWGLTAVHEVSFAGLTEIHVVVRKSDNSGRGNDYFLRCAYSKSIRDEVPFNNKLVRFAAPRILNAAKEQGVRVVGEDIPWDAVR